MDAAQACLSLHLSKCHIVGNHVSWLNYVCTDLFQILSTSFCGIGKEIKIVSPGNLVNIEFFADASENGRGFNLMYEAVSYGR